MSELTFDGQAHTLTLRDRDGHVVGTWDANNRTDSQATLQFVPNGNYIIQDSRAPTRHDAQRDSINGAFGTRGIVQFNVPGHDGVGVHAGRQTARDATPEHGVGPDHVTEGCIRTTEQAMGTIVDTMRNDPLTDIHVVHNRNQRQ
jgi:hypothetical protein